LSGSGFSSAHNEVSFDFGFHQAVFLALIYR